MVDRPCHTEQEQNKFHACVIEFKKKWKWKSLNVQYQFDVEVLLL